MLGKPSEPLITIQATPNELIALGHLIYSYHRHIEHKSSLTQGQRELRERLERFQRRIADHI